MESPKERTVTGRFELSITDHKGVNASVFVVEKSAALVSTHVNVIAATIATSDDCHQRRLPKSDEDFICWAKPLSFHFHPGEP